MRWRALAAVLGGLVACGGDDADVEARALRGEDVIAATTAAGTAVLTMHDHAEPADPGFDHGTSGGRSQDIPYTAALDFTRDRSVVRFELAAPEIPTIEVEARLVDDVVYVRDGSWLCPGCGLDGDEPLPRDKWITLDEPGADHAFAPSSTVFFGHLWWLGLVTEPVTGSGDGDEPTYRVEVPTARANELLRAAEPDNEYVSTYQGDTITIAFTTDAEGRLATLEVDYRQDDRNSTFTATVEEYGAEVDVEVPPADELLVEG